MQKKKTNHITDSDGTPFSISPKLTLAQHKQTVELLTEFNHIFTTDTFNIKPTHVNLNRIKAK